MVKIRFPIGIFYLSLVSMIFIACSNESKKTLSDNTNTEYTENMKNSDQRSLFIIETDSVNSSWETIEASNFKQRTVVINPNFISVDSLAVGRDFSFNIYDEESLDGEISRVSTDISGVKSISGLFHEDKGSFVFTVNEGRLLGQIRLTDRDQLIQIRYSEELNKYVITELNRRDLDVLPGSAPMRRGYN